MKHSPDITESTDRAVESSTSPCTAITKNTYDERVAVYNQMSTRPVFDRSKVNAFDEAEWMSAFRITQ